MKRTKLTFFKALAISCSLLAPLIFSAAAHAETCPAPHEVFSSGQNGKITKNGNLWVFNPIVGININSMVLATVFQSAEIVGTGNVRCTYFGNINGKPDGSTERNAKIVIQLSEKSEVSPITATAAQSKWRKGVCPASDNPFSGESFVEDCPFKIEHISVNQQNLSPF